MSSPMPGKPISYPSECGYPLDHFDGDDRREFGSPIENGILTFLSQKEGFSWSPSTREQNIAGSDGFVTRDGVTSSDQVKSRQRYRLTDEGKLIAKQDPFSVLPEHMEKSYYADIPLELINNRNVSREGRDCKKGSKIIEYSRFHTLTWGSDIPVIISILGEYQRKLVAKLEDEFAARQAEKIELYEYIQNHKAFFGEERARYQALKEPTYWSEKIEGIQLRWRKDQADNYWKMNTYIKESVYPQSTILARYVLTPDELQQIYSESIRRLKKHGVVLP